MASADQIARSIEPGSTDYGDRQVIAQRLKDSLSQAPAGPAAPTVAPGAANPAVSNPLDRLLGGAHSSDLPVTSGLSQGPGSGPINTAGLAGSPKAEQLRAVALGAKSPVLRQLARMALRAEVQRGV